MKFKKQQLEPDTQKWTGSKLRKEPVKAVYCHPAYLTYIWSTSWETLGWRKRKLESRLLGEISITSYADYTNHLAESKKELKSLLMKVKEEHEEADLKFNIQKTTIMAPGPITSWQIDGETMETVIDFILLGFKITADGDCSREIKRFLLFGRKAMKNLDSMWKTEISLCW